MNRRSVLTELGADAQALRGEDRDAILFDLGLGALQADFCVRIDDDEACCEPAPACRPAGLRARQSRDGHHPARQSAPRLPLPARPHRGVSADPAAIGQEPGRAAYPCAAKTPEERPHPSGDRAGSGGVDSLRASLPRACRRATGSASRARSRPRISTHSSTMLAAFGDPEIVAIKQRVQDAVRAGQPPAELTARSPWPHQHSCRAAANEGRGRCFAGAVGMAGEPRSG